MWSVLLDSFLFLFILKSFVAVGNAYPTTGSDIEPTKNNIMTSINDSTSVTTYTCVYIPSNLDFCTFGSKSRENIWYPKHKRSENKKYKLLESNKIYFTTSRPSLRVPGTKKFKRQPFVKTIIYEIQGCVPPRLPFVLPWCTDEDLNVKKSEIRQLYPFMIDGFSKATYEFPTYDISKQTRTKSA